MRPALRTGKEMGRKPEPQRFLRWRGAGDNSSHTRRSFDRSRDTQNRTRGLPPINRLRARRPGGAPEGKKKSPPQSFQRVFSRPTSGAKKAAASGPNKVVAGMAAVAGVGAAALIRRRRGGAEKPVDAVPPAAA
jgi:MYXO-CTERM domain-containing protein